MATGNSTGLAELLAGMSFLIIAIKSRNGMTHLVIYLE